MKFSHLCDDTVNTFDQFPSQSHPEFFLFISRTQFFDQFDDKSDVIMTAQFLKYRTIVFGGEDEMIERVDEIICEIVFVIIDAPLYVLYQL
jgi:hypothetical protein